MSSFSLHRLALPLMLSLAALASPQIAQATHFRGGSITWQALALDGDGIKDDVRITVKTAWRNDYIDQATLTRSPNFPVTKISEERLCVGPGTTVVAPATCSGQPGTEYALTTTLFEARNLDPDVHYLVRFSSSARISDLRNNADGDWNIQTMIYLKDGNLAPKVDLPIILEVPMRKLAEGGGTEKLTNWTFDISSSDPNADKLRYRLANQSELGCTASGGGCGYTNPLGLSINPNTGLLTWTGSGNLTAGHMYSAGIVAEDVDAFGADKSKTHVDFILVLVDKAALEFDPQEDIEPADGGTFPETRNVRVEKGDSYTFTVTASDVDTTSLGSLQGTLVESPANTFTFTPGEPDDENSLEPGSYPITFLLADSTNTYSDSYLVINFIVPDPDAPKILNIEGDRTDYTNTADMPGDEAAQVVDAGLDAIVEDINSPQLDGGFLLFNVTFTDGSYERLGVESVGDGPGQIRRDGRDVYYSGQPIGVVDAVQDGIGRALRIDFTSANATLEAVQALVRSLTYQDTFPLRPEGDRALSLYIQDAEGHSNSYDFFVNVHPHLTAPEPGTGPMLAANRISVTEGTTAALSDSNIRYADPDGDPITFTVESVTHGRFEYVGNPGVAINSFSQEDVTLGRVAFAHDGSENEPTYALTASDGTGNTTGPDAGEVTFFGVNDNDPTISGTPATLVTEGSEYSFTPTASDADVGIGGDLVFSIQNKPSWATFDTSSGKLSGTPLRGDAGTYTNIVISVSDDDNLTKVSLDPFSIEVEEAPDSDGDGLVDYLDPDDDNIDTDGDGIPDGMDVDVDGDGTNDNGTDSDGDGINDEGEGTDDTDGDGIPNYLDTDSDNDGISDGDEGASDPDGDGIPSYLDTDNDNDGVPDSEEGSADTDGDGIPDYLDSDVDGDGIPDTYEGTGDSDGDGIPDYRDTDSDNDGVSDADEGTGDTDGDGTPDYLDASIDEDRDGIPDILEGTGDSDGDGVPDFRDIDSDNDGVPDALELPGLKTDTDKDGIPDRFDVDQTGGVDANHDGIDDNAKLPDSDEDGRPDHLDPDQDNDGIPDILESGAYGFDSDNDGIDDRWDASMPGSKDEDGDGIADGVSLIDTDADGIPDARDLDSDRDGVSDAAESGASGSDIDGDGIDDFFDADRPGAKDANGDGIADDRKPRDADGDGVPDFRDLDSDNDSIPDVIESRGLDLDEDGLLDLGGTITSQPIDSDGDGVPDMRDTDSDNDGETDISKTIYRVLDKNGDGRIDDNEDIDEDGIPDVIDSEPGQRGSRSDNDGDGVPASRDLDDDGDGIPDSMEGDGDTDGDGTIDRLDRDSDNDGIPDRIEMGWPAPTGTDSDLDGLDDAYDVDATGGIDANGDGVDDRFTDRDSDGDGVSDRLDDDSDNDGLSDMYEILLTKLSGADSDGDGIDDAIDVDMTGGTDANGDGVDDALVNLADTDGDGLEDYRDPDSDNDGIMDGDEDGDFNGDGINDRFQKDPGLKTGLKGGGGSFGFVLLAGLLLLGGARRIARTGGTLAAILVAAVLGTTQMSAAQAAEAECHTGADFTDGCLSFGVGYFVTALEPDDSQTSWKLVDDRDHGYKLSLEYRFRERWFVELGYADLGSAVVESLNPSIAGREEVDYEAPSLLIGRLLFDPANRFNAHVKAGYAMLRTSAADRVVEDQLEGDQLALGAGLRWKLLPHVQLQAEYEYYDKDAQQAGVAVRYNF